MDKIITLAYPTIMINVSKSPASGLGATWGQLRGGGTLREPARERRPFFPLPLLVLPGTFYLNQEVYLKSLGEVSILWQH